MLQLTAKHHALELDRSVALAATAVDVCVALQQCTQRDVSLVFAFFVAQHPFSAVIGSDWLQDPERRALVLAALSG